MVIIEKKQAFSTFSDDLYTTIEILPVEELEGYGFIGGVFKAVGRVVGGAVHAVGKVVGGATKVITKTPVTGAVVTAITGNPVAGVAANVVSRLVSKKSRKKPVKIIKVATAPTKGSKIFTKMSPAEVTKLSMGAISSKLFMERQKKIPKQFIATLFPSVIFSTLGRGKNEVIIKKQGTSFFNRIRNIYSPSYPVGVQTLGQTFWYDPQKNLVRFDKETFLKLIQYGLSLYGAYQLSKQAGKTAQQLTVIQLPPQKVYYYATRPEMQRLQREGYSPLEAYSIYKLAETYQKMGYSKSQAFDLAKNPYIRKQIKAGASPSEAAKSYQIEQIKKYLPYVLMGAIALIVITERKRGEIPSYPLYFYIPAERIPLATKIFKKST